MTSTSPTVEKTRISTVEPIAAPPCEALLQCADACCDPVPCGRPAVARVSFRCRSNGCDHAADMLLLCIVCTGQADAIGTVLARRPI